MRKFALFLFVLTIATLPSILFSADCSKSETLRGITSPMNAEAGVAQNRCQIGRKWESYEIRNKKINSRGRSEFDVLCKCQIEASAGASAPQASTPTTSTPAAPTPPVATPPAQQQPTRRTFATCAKATDDEAFCPRNASDIEIRNFVTGICREDGKQFQGYERNLIYNDQMNAQYVKYQCRTPAPTAKPASTSAADNKAEEEAAAKKKVEDAEKDCKEITFSSFDKTSLACTCSATKEPPESGKCPSPEQNACQSGGGKWKTSTTGGFCDCGKNKKMAGNKCVDDPAAIRAEQDRLVREEAEKKVVEEKAQAEAEKERQRIEAEKAKEEEMLANERKIAKPDPEPPADAPAAAKPEEQSATNTPTAEEPPARQLSEQPQPNAEPIAADTKTASAPIPKPADETARTETKTETASESAKPASDAENEFIKKFDALTAAFNEKIRQLNEEKRLKNEKE